MRAHRHRWTSPERPDVLECADCGAICTWDPRERSTHPDAGMPAERRPCAGWVREDGRWSLRCGSLVAVAYDPRPGREVQGWAVEVYRLGSANHGAQADGGYVATHDGAVPARLAAEDALRAIAAEILRAVGA